MPVSRRTFAKRSAAFAAAAAGARLTSDSPTATGSLKLDAQTAPADAIPPAIRALKPYPGRAVPITEAERRARIEKARRLMTEHGMGAIVLEDCLYITENGPRFFTQPSPAIDRPFA